MHSSQSGYESSKISDHCRLLVDQIHQPLPQILLLLRVSLKLALCQQSLELTVLIGGLSGDVPIVMSSPKELAFLGVVSPQWHDILLLVKGGMWAELSVIVIRYWGCFPAVILPFVHHVIEVGL